MDIILLRQHLAGIFGHKWDLVILDQLAKEPLRYMEIASQVREVDCKFTEGVLSKNLKRLAADGLVCRQMTEDGHFGYGLTTRAKHIMVALGKISDIDGEALRDEPEPDDGGG